MVVAPARQAQDPWRLDQVCSGLSLSIGSLGGGLVLGRSHGLPQPFFWYRH
jgi:hypothetical protein